jgi:ATP adenylyltransferase
VTAASGPDVSSCIFCSALERGDDEPLVLVRGATCFVILNLYPYNNGHVMVVPYRHTPMLAGLTADELQEMALLTQRSEVALVEAYSPHGINVGINLGKPAGAGILEHIHVHLVPRWNGDTNFMTTVAEARVLPETLSSTAARIRAAWPSR